MLMRFPFQIGGEKPIECPLPDLITCSAVVFARPDAPTLNSQTAKRNAQRWIATNVPAPMAEMIAKFLYRPSLEIYTLPNGKIAEDTIARVRRFGITDEEYDAIRSAPHAYYIQGTDVPLHPRAGTWAALCVALSLAADSGSLLADLDGSTIWDTRKPFNSLHWNGLMRTREFLRTPIAHDDYGTTTVSTVGMARFSLPELQTLRVPRDLAPHIVRPLLGVAQQLAGLVMSQTGNSQIQLTAVDIPRELSLTHGSVLIANCEDPDERTTSLTDLPLRLSLSTQPEIGQVLTVQRPAKAHGSQQAWLRTLAQHFEPEPPVAPRDAASTPAKPPLVESNR